MLYRINRLFNVSKTRALVVAVLCFIAGVPFLFGGELAMLTFMFWVYALIYGCIWYYKYQRDQKIIVASQVTKQEPIEVTPPMTSPGSHRLFVPNPLDRP
jgi:hypothetical protein